MKIFLFLLLTLAACSFREEKVHDVENYAVTGPIGFKALSERLLKPKCLECHTGDNSRSGFDLISYSKLMESGDVIPGDPEASPLYKRVENDEMPQPPRPPLSEAGKKFLYRWIKEGARE